MSWQNQNTKKKVFTLTRPLEFEDELMASIPENAIITAFTRTTRTVRVTYVIENVFTIDDIIEANQMTVKPVKLDRVGKKQKTKASRKTIKTQGETLAVLNIADFHLNRLIFANDSYGVDYNIDLASEVWMRIIEQAVDNLRANRYKIDKIILNTAGDFLNSDTINGTTTRGTPQTNDLPWKQLFQRAAHLLEFAILELSKVAPVEYFYVRGNHDEQTGFYLTTWLSARFKDVENVIIDDSPRPKQVVRYKKNILIFTHGDYEGPRALDLPFLEPESLKYISDSTNIEVISGHVHTRTMKTERGVLWETLNSACPAQDDWTYSKGFGGLNQEASIHYYDDQGRVQTDIIETTRILKAIQSEDEDETL